MDGGSGCRGVENGVEEELPVVKKINSLINPQMESLNNLSSFSDLLDNTVQCLSFKPDTKHFVYYLKQRKV